MAWKMQLAVPQGGMSYIWNVSQHVGVHSKCSNLPDDVELVQRLILHIHRYAPPNGPNRRAPSIGFLQVANGRMDSMTAFEILWRDRVVYQPDDDGIVSPARNGMISYGSGNWLIARLNAKAAELNRAAWEALPEQCSPPLKQSLLTKTMP